MDAREETSGAIGMQQQSKGPRLKGAATSRKTEDIRQDLQEGSRAADREAKGRAFNQESKRVTQHCGSANPLRNERTDCTE
jgi:hypothetical protein